MKRLPSLDISRKPERNLRSGAATLDYILGLGVVLPLLAIVIPQGRRMMQLVFEMTCALVSWPFM